MEGRWALLGGAAVEDEMRIKVFPAGRRAT